MEANAEPETEVAALFGLRASYRHLNERTRAVAILERIIKDYPGSPQTARALLDAGRLHRSLGADRLAMSRFYAVLQATLRIPDLAWAEQYKQLARTAQYEIAETHLRAGRYPEAERYFTRFSLLELAPADRARGAFKVIEARAAAGRHEAVVKGVNIFIDQFAEDQHVPAALHFASTTRSHR
ncbi:MAG: tetratricopeptide repeat protein [Candidatus Synoicihabitans palmerolidicus]|nr:tetratricopeptide repeat protein [Candidatus Synoicihabitans palmerolidicus]